jgi:hypothetical protein
MTAFSKEKWLKGVFFYNWVADPSFGGPLNNCMTPRGKPAEDYLRELFEAKEPKQPIEGEPRCTCTL